MSVSVMPPALERLVKNLQRFPGVGEKTAIRYALHVLRGDEAIALELSTAISELHKRISYCSTCYAFSETDPCPVCSDPRRNRETVCVVEGPGDLLAMEATGSYKGLYHVLQGVLSPQDGVGPDELKIKELLDRIATNTISEIVIATSSTAAGEATCSYLISRIDALSQRLDQSKLPVITRLACGIPMGMDVKYADAVTLKRALEHRFNCASCSK